jgi:hypothetical protein
MACEVYCRRKDCQYHGPYVRGYEPRLCPRCRRDARWSTRPGEQESDPTVTPDDRSFLHALRIDHGELET